jgi:branched-chain amino acid transport system ATP-binding protein
MLALGMAFLSEPKLLMIDELSLGLAPAVVEQLLPIVRQLRDNGTTVILVEQSVNVALTVADTAYFLEKGQIRFHGPTAELLDRPDVLRSVFLEGAGAAIAQTNGEAAPATPAEPAPTVEGEPAVEPAAASPATDATAQEQPAEQPATEPSPIALQTFGVSCRFGGIRAVNDVSLSVAKGEIVGIIGSNGAGKTTLFDLISGYNDLDGGRIELAGRDITNLGTARRAARGLGRSFQDAKLWPALTVAEAIAVSLERFVEVKDPFSAALHLPGVFDSELETSKRVDELIELMGLESFRTKFLRELSTGSRRIVDLACLVAHRPTVVLLDEPSSGIAQRETEALAPLLLRIRDGLGAAVLVIEHDMPLITAVADRLVAMDQGSVIAEGSSDVVLNDPQVIASYLGNSEEVIARSGQLATS